MTALDPYMPQTIATDAFAMRSGTKGSCSMPRDPRVYLADVEDAASRVLRQVESLDLDTYLNQRRTRERVERRIDES